MHKVFSQEVKEALFAMAGELRAVMEERGKFPGQDRLNIYGVPRGGVPVAYLLSSYWPGSQVVYDPRDADVIVDDIYDSGRTMERHAFLGKPFLVLFDKRKEPWAGQWLVMPWEVEGKEDRSAEDIVVRLFQYIGEDPDREGLRETPARFLKAWQEWAWGYGQDPDAIFKTFEDGSESYDEMVFQGSVPFYSHCEHHLAPFFGVAHIGYIPDGRIAGLSKLARLLDVYARRLQVQERLSVQVADALMKHLKPLGVGVVVQARHLCMESRGIQKIGTITTTSALRGVVKDKPEARAEFMSFVSNSTQGVKGV